jgi:hypothetical protein
MDVPTRGLVGKYCHTLDKKKGRLIAGLAPTDLQNFTDSDPVGLNPVEYYLADSRLAGSDLTDSYPIDLHPAGGVPDSDPGS